MKPRRAATSSTSATTPSPRDSSASASTAASSSRLSIEHSRAARIPRPLRRVHRTPRRRAARPCDRRRRGGRTAWPCSNSSPCATALVPASGTRCRGWPKRYAPIHGAPLWFIGRDPTQQHGGRLRQVVREREAHGGAIAHGRRTRRRENPARESVRQHARRRGERRPRPRPRRLEGRRALARPGRLGGPRPDILRRRAHLRFVLRRHPPPLA